jgi:hypothetical protein
VIKNVMSDFVSGDEFDGLRFFNRNKFVRRSGGPCHTRMGICQTGSDCTMDVAGLCVRISCKGFDS